MDFAHAFESEYDDNNRDQSLSPGVDCQGALEAARRFTDDQVLHTGYRLVLVNGDIVIHIIIIILINLLLIVIILLLLLRFLSDPTISAQQRDKFLCPDNRQLFNVKTDQEVIHTITSTNTIIIIAIMTNRQLWEEISSFHHSLLLISSPQNFYHQSPYKVQFLLQVAALVRELLSQVGPPVQVRKS